MGQHVTQKTIEQYLALHANRRELQRRAKALDKEAEEIESHLAAYVAAHGGKAKSVKRSGYVLSLQAQAGSVQWKPAFISVAGQDAAEKLIADAEPRESLHVEKI